MKLLSPLVGTGSGNITQARTQLALAGAAGQEVLGTMNHDFNRINQGQILAMFEATESSTHESIMDNWAITNYFSGEDEASQARINLIHTVSPVILEIFQARQTDFATILEVIDDAIANPSTLPSNISATKLQTFKTYWEQYLAGDGRPMATLDTNDADFLDQMQATSQSQWLEIARQMNDEGQYDQAQQILEQIVLGAEFPDGDSVEDQLSRLLTTSQITDITSNVERELDREMPRNQVIQMYEEQGFFTDEGLEGFGLVLQPSGQFLDPVAGITITRPQAINRIVDQSITVTREKLTTQQMLWEVADDDQLLNMAASGTLNLDMIQTEALNLYKDISGAGAEWGNLSSKRADFWRQELLLNVGLIAISATGVGLLAAGGRAVALGSRALSATRLATSTGRIARAARASSGVARFSTTAVVDGAVFHNLNAAVSTPIVGTAAFDNYAEGMAHSIGMYAAFGAGNALWARGVGRIAQGSGAAAQWAQRSQQTIREAAGRGAQYDITTTTFRARFTEAFTATPRAMWGQSGEVILTIVANQPRLALEAAAFTQMATDAEFGSPEYWEEFGRQVVTMNLLWAMPRVQPRQLRIEDQRPDRLLITDQRVSREEAPRTQPRPNTLENLTGRYDHLLRIKNTKERALRDLDRTQNPERAQQLQTELTFVNRRLREVEALRTHAANPDSPQGPSVPERAAVDPAAPNPNPRPAPRPRNHRETAPRLRNISRSLNQATEQYPQTAPLERNSAIVPKLNNQSLGIRIETQQTVTNTSTIQLTRTFYNNNRRGETISLSAGGTQKVELLNQNLIIRRNGTQIEMHLAPKSSYTVEGVNFTFESGRNYQSEAKTGSFRATFLKQEGETLVFRNRAGNELTIDKTNINQMVAEGRVSRVD